MALVCEYKSTLPQTQTLYRIEIHGGGSGDFCLVRGKEPQITIEGKPKDPHHWYAPGSCTFTIYANNPAAKGFIEALGSSDEEAKYFVVVYGGTFYNQLFVGVVAPEEVTIAEQSWPDYEITIRAVDALSYLQGVLYRQQDGSPYLGRVSFVEHLRNAFKNLVSKDYYTFPGIYFIFDWNNAKWQKAHDFMLEDLYIDHSTFQRRKNTIGNKDGEPLENAGFEIDSCFDVIRHIAEGFHFRVSYKLGAFFFEQIPARANQSGKTYWYDINMNYIGSGGVGGIIDVGCGPQSGSPAWLLDNGATRSFLTGLRQAAVKYSFEGLGNYLLGKKWAFVVPGSINKPGLGQVAVQNETTRIRMTGTFEWTMTRLPNTPANLGFVQLNFYVKISVGGSVFSRLLKTDIPAFYNNSSFHPERWVASEQYDIPLPYKIDVEGLPNPIPTPIPAKRSHYFEIETIPLKPEMDGAEIEVEIGAVMYASDSSPVSVIDLPTTVQVVDAELHLFDKDENKIEEAFITTVIDGNPKNSKEVTIETKFGDGPTKTVPNRITINGIEENTEAEDGDWSSGVASGPIYEVLARGIMAVGGKTNFVLAGEIEGPINASHQINYGGYRWYLLNGTHHTGKDLMRGEWITIALGSGSGQKKELFGFKETRRTPNPSYKNTFSVKAKHYTGPGTCFSIPDEYQVYNSTDQTPEELQALIYPVRNGVIGTYGRADVDGYTISADGTQICFDSNWPLDAADHFTLYVVLP